MKTFLIALVVALNLYSIQCLESYQDILLSAAQNLQGHSRANKLDFLEAIDLENKQREMMKDLRKSLANIDFSDALFPNISEECFIQFDNLTIGLVSGDKWAIKGKNKCKSLIFNKILKILKF